MDPSLMLTLLVSVVLILVALVVLPLFIIYLIDRRQTTHAIRHNFPVIGRFRYFFEYLAPFFRQYFAEDRQELPFNRAERNWVYHAAKNENNTQPFGSTRDITKAGTVFFTNCLYPTAELDELRSQAVTLGPYTRQPYRHTSFFNISAMSYGAISKPAILALSRGAKAAGIWMNTGEGGVSPHHLEGGCDLVFQIGTAMFGVRDEQGHLCDRRLKELAAIEQVRMFEIKLSQGAKPGKGGILPGVKVTPEIARIRNIPVGETVISPNRFTLINNAEQLLDFIAHVREVTGKPVGIKLCIGSLDEVEELLQAVNVRGEESAPDFITVDSGDGGSGAAPMPLIDNVGFPIRESLPRLLDLLNRYHLRTRVKVIASGKLLTPVGVAWALCAGADFVNSARGFMFALGCIQSLKCNTNTCPTGITTQDEYLQGGLNPEDKAVRVTHYAQNVIKEVELIAHACGVKEPRLFQRHHARVLTDPGKSVSLAELYPEQ